MAEPRQARVLAYVGDQNPGALLLLQVEGQAELELKGGKYIIINTGLQNAEGKVIKRAYSLFGVQAERRQFLLAAVPVKDGIASQFLRTLQPDDRLTFSGPWGRFFWPADAPEKRIRAAAFGSGITGILGYLATLPDDCSVELSWYQDPAGPVLSPEVMSECAGRFSNSLRLRSLQDDPTLDFPSPAANERYIAAGEGGRVDYLFQYLRERGVKDENLQSEIFYRSPQDQSHAKTEL